MAAVVAERFNFEVKRTVCRNFEILRPCDRDPLLRARKLNLHLAAHDLHDLFVARVKGVFARHHDTERFEGTVFKADGAAGNFSLKIDVCFFIDGDVGKL